MAHELNTQSTLQRRHELNTQSTLQRRPSRSAATTTFSKEVFDNEVVPSSLQSIAPVLRVATEIQNERPRAAYLCRFYAFEKADRLDPSSTGRGVRRFKTGLLQRLERDNASSLASRTKKTDAREIKSFYEQYYEKYIRALDKGEQPDRALLGKAYQTANVLFEVLCAVNKTEKVAPEAKKMALLAIRQAVETIDSNPKGDNNDGIIKGAVASHSNDLTNPVVVKLEPEDIIQDPVSSHGGDLAAPTVVANLDPADTTTAGVGTGHMVQWEGQYRVLECYVDLLSHMKKEHPETFNNLNTIKSISVQTHALNLLGEAYVSFANIRVSNMAVEDISHFRDIICDLETCFKFNLRWLRERVDSIELVVCGKSSYSSSRTGDGELEELELCIEARKENFVN